MPPRKKRQQPPAPSFLPPALHHLCQSNDLPLAAERTVVAEQIPLLEQRILAVKTQITQLEDISDGLISHKYELQSALALCKGIISPVRRLSRELVQKIILNNDTHTQLDGHGPWLYACVCRSWREALLSLHSIWATVRVDEQHHFLRPRNATLHMLQTAISRAENHPLDLDFSLHKPHFGWKLLSIAIENSAKWKSLALCLSGELWSRMTESRLDIPILESLHLCASSSFPQLYGSTVTGRAFEVAPSLRRVSLESLHEPLTAKLPWSQITHFREWETWMMFKTSTQHARMDKLLRRMPNLANLDLDGIVPENATDAPLSLPNLKTLTLHHHLDFIDRMHVPNLSCLAVPNDTHLQKIATLPRSRIGTIETLIANDGFRPKSAEAADVLMATLSRPSMTSITTLELRRVPSEHFFAAFSVHQKILPHLERLILSDHFLGVWSLTRAEEKWIEDWVRLLAGREVGRLRELLFVVDFKRMGSAMRCVGQWSYWETFGVLRKSHGLLVGILPRRDRWSIQRIHAN